MGVEPEKLNAMRSELEVQIENQSDDPSVKITVEVVLPEQNKTPEA